jgi:glycosyltransferase involved in cell wall biosynthesis
MRILIASSHQSIVGGIEKYLQALIPALLERGHAVAMLYEHSAPASADTVDPRGARLPVWYWRDESGAPSVRQDVAHWRPDVIYLNSVGSLEMEDFALNCCPAVLYAHAYHGTCTTGRKCHSFPDVQPCHRKFSPMCLALHYPRRCGGLNPKLAWQMFQAQRGHHTRLTRYQSVLVASAHMHAEFERNGVNREKLHLAPLPITDILPENVDRSRRPAAHSILFAGRIMDVKGLDYLIQAIPPAARALGRSLTLTVAGDGAQRARLERLAATTGVQARFAGWLESEPKMEAMRQADLLAVPSLWPEPFGLVGIEAGCFALPAVGYAVGGIPDWLIGGRTGEIAPGDPPTVQGLADAIVRALGDRDHYARLCRGAWESSLAFTLQRHLSLLEPILKAAYSPSHDQPALSIAEGLDRVALS